MIASASTIQYSWMPSRCCQINTDSPNEAPSDSTTVPTITSAATTLRVTNIMISRIRLTAAITTIIRS